MQDLDFLIPIFGILLTMIPVAGVTLVLTARFALKPLAETIASALRDLRGEATPDTAAQLRALTEEVRMLAEHVERLERAHDFERQLRTPSS